MTTRHFGLVTATIDDDRRRVELRFRPRDQRSPYTALSDGHRQRCLIWALDALADLRDNGYIFETPEAVPSG